MPIKLVVDNTRFQCTGCKKQCKFTMDELLPQCCKDKIANELHKQITQEELEDRWNMMS